MKSKLVFLLLSALFVSIQCHAQIISKPKKIKVVGDYLHTQTEILFPRIIDDFTRISIYSFDKKQTNIGVTYENVSNQEKTTLSIYVYPAGIGSEVRLRGEYFNCLQSIANVNKSLKMQQHPITYNNSGYRINGFKAENHDLGISTTLSIFECGHWFFKIRITSSNLDSLLIENLENKILNLFVPTNLVQKSPLNSKADIHFAPGAFRDSLMLGCVMGSALEKLKWALSNVDSLQRASGFPGLYLDMHIAALKAFVNFEKEHPYMSRTQPTIDHLNELKSLMDNGFLDEFIMDQYEMVMIVPDNTIFDFVGFEEWKKLNAIQINLNHMYSVIEYN